MAESLGALLARTRRAGARLATYPEPAPADLVEGYRVQDEMAEAMGRPVIGWKIGLTSHAAQEAMGVREPICGPLFDGLVHASPVHLTVEAEDLRVLEAEIAVRMARDLPRTGAAVTREDVAAAIATVHPAFELATKRLPGTIRESAPWIAADGAVNQHLVLGEGIDWRPDLDLGTEPVEVHAGDTTVATGIGANALGDPLAVVTWLANHLHDRGRILRAGDIVSTGLLTAMIAAGFDTPYTARFANLGTVTVQLDQA